MWYSDHCDSAAARVWVRSQCSTIITGALFVTEKERRLISIRARELWLVTVIASCRLQQLLNLHTFKFGIFAFTRSVKAAPPSSLPPNIWRLGVSWEPKSPGQKSIIRFQVLVLEEEREEPSLCCYWNPIHSLFDFVGTGNPQVLPSLLWWCYDFFPQVCSCCVGLLVFHK